MGLQDRDYSRSQNTGFNFADFFRRVFLGDFYLGTLFGIRIRLHNSLILLIALRLLFSGGNFGTALTSSLILFGVVLLHEFGHCFAARSVGGRGDDVLLWPLGGLAFVHTPKRPWPSFVATAGGPLVNVVICVVCAVAIRALSGVWVVGNPLAPFLMSLDVSGSVAQLSGTISFYLWWIYSTSLALLLFNLLPIFPLDGGRLLQSTLWPKLGFYAATNVACIVGMAGSGIIGILNLGNFFLMFLMLSCFLTCLHTRNNLRELADEVWEEERYGGSSSWSGGDSWRNPHPDRARINLPRVEFGKKRAPRPKDDRFTLRDLNPFEILARRKRRKQFEKLMKDD